MATSGKDKSAKASYSNEANLRLGTSDPRQ